MEQDYINLYKQITGNEYEEDYVGPEQQGALLKKCTILKSVKEIEYSNHCKKVEDNEIVC